MNDPEEKARVELVRSFNKDKEKKEGDEKCQDEYLESTRSFGDWEFKGNGWIDQKDQEVSVEPEILEIPINNVQYLIIGSHGMFESNINDNENDDTINGQVCKFFVEEIKKNKPYSNIIHEYFEKIIPEKNDGDNNKGLDNMSCIVINLKNDSINQYFKKKDLEEVEDKKREEEENKKRKKEEEEKKENELINNEENIIENYKENEG